MYSRLSILFLTNTRLWIYDGNSIVHDPLNNVNESKDLENGFFGQMWPYYKYLMSIFSNMNCAICWNNYNDYFLTTLISVTSIYVTRFVKTGNNVKSAGKERHWSSLVCASETTRATISSSCSDKDQAFNEWIANVIDGDSSFQISKQGYTSLEITVGLEDLSLLIAIKNKFGASIKLRSRVKA